ncbi:MAG: flagellar biosynthesis protein FlhA [Proteobacteria bacterium]|jgi:type III secretory pathway component EscV|nr:flagellar biosynthesis protein FlhA [Pseudomonadota bacterium]
MTQTTRRRLFPRAPGAGEVGVAALAIAVIVVLVVPIPQALLDLLIAVNLGLSVVLFTAALSMRSPLAFGSFPTLLLVATLYRLALNVSSVRLILSEADAGEIIGAFGSFAVGGDILIGAVPFGILAIVLFLVITKGAERVAEVSARFSLDALPGMQLAIETDLRSGAISARELSRRRSELERRSHYYGALDGAMKFVRGDAIANLAIIGVNLVGGVAVGALRHGMSVGAALDTYGRLTIGDGLVTLLPAVLISTAAGLLVTRLGQGDADKSFGGAVAAELGKEPFALLVAAAAMIALAALPGFPVWPFAVVGALLAIPGALHLRAALAAGRTASRNGAVEVDDPRRPFDLDRTQELVDALAAEKPVLVRETVPRLVGLPALAELLTLMRADGLDEGHLGDLLEALARDGGEGGPVELAERLRRRMSGVITSRLVGAERSVDVAMLERDVEAVLDNALCRTADGERLAMPEADLRGVVAACAAALGAMEKPLLLVPPRVRRPLAAALRAHGVAAEVIAHGELEGDVEVRIAARISV